MSKDNFQNSIFTLQIQNLWPKGSSIHANKMKEEKIPTLEGHSICTEIGKIIQTQKKKKNFYIFWQKKKQKNLHEDEEIDIPSSQAAA